MITIWAAIDEWGRDDYVSGHYYSKRAAKRAGTCKLIPFLALPSKDRKTCTILRKGETVIMYDRWRQGWLASAVVASVTALALALAIHDSRSEMETVA